MYLMELEHALERKVSSDISVHDEKGLAIVSFFDEVSGEGERTCSVHRNCFMREGNFDSKTVSVMAKLFLQHVGHVAIRAEYQTAVKKEYQT